MPGADGFIFNNFSPIQKPSDRWAFLMHINQTMFKLNNASPGPGRHYQNIYLNKKFNKSPRGKVSDHVVTNENKLKFKLASAFQVILYTSSIARLLLIKHFVDTTSFSPNFN